VPIVLISESLLLRSTAVDGRLLRDRVLCGFCVRMNARRRTFRIATSVAGKQFRMTLGYWPLMSVEDARQRAMEVLAECRAGRRPSDKIVKALPTLREALVSYCAAKGIKASSAKRYDSMVRTHFPDWLDRSVEEMGGQEFAEHCLAFAQSKGNALVEVGRGIVAPQFRLWIHTGPTSFHVYKTGVAHHGRQLHHLLLNGFASQGLSRRAMVVQLNNLGVKAPRGGTWSLGQVQRVVTAIGLAS
jgi:hypothetical protein